MKRIKLNSKTWTTLVIVGGLMLIGGSIYAEELDEAIKAYAHNPSFDFLGRGYDKMFFQMLEGADSTVWDKIRAIPQDIKTMPQQLLAFNKMVEQNYPAYVGLGGTAGLKAFMGTEEFNKAALSILKLAKKIDVKPVLKALFRFRL